MDNLRAMIPSARRQDAVGRLVRALVRAGFTQKAYEVQDAYRAFLVVVDASLETLNASAIAVAQEKTKAHAHTAAQTNSNSTSNTDPQALPKIKEITRENTKWMLGLWP